MVWILDNKVQNVIVAIVSEIIVPRVETTYSITNDLNQVDQIEEPQLEETFR